MQANWLFHLFLVRLFLVQRHCQLQSLNALTEGCSNGVPYPYPRLPISSQWQSLPLSALSTL